MPNAHPSSHLLGRPFAMLASLSAGVSMVSAVSAAPAAPAAAPAPEAAPAVADPSGESAAEGGVPSGMTLEQAMERVPPHAALGLRSVVISSQQKVLSTVVVVHDAAGFLEALAGWAGPGRYPILWDDGTLRSREDIARFVRAFKPERVVRYEGQGEGLPEDREAAAERLARVLSDSMLPTGAEDGRPPLEAVRALGLEPFGAVVLDPEDPAWAGGLALAAGRLQAMVVVDAPAGETSGTMSVEELGALTDAVESSLEGLGVGFRGLKDLDAITLAMNAPVKVQHQSGQQGGGYSLTDLVGRADEGDVIGGGQRWAWTGQLLGDESASLYRAMSALFLLPSSAWVFDTYPEDETFGAYSGQLAAQALQEKGMKAIPLRGGLDTWRMGVARGLDAGLILLNTSGGSDYFDFRSAGGRGRTGDMPVLNTPAIAHVVHSYSAERGDDRSGISGRLLEQGVYAYYGSVNEPYLGAFIPTPLVAKRLTQGVALGAAVRYDEPQPVPAGRDIHWLNKPWKLTLLGDPLITLGSVGQRGTGELPLQGGAALSDELKAALAARDFEKAADALIILGRDGDAARLAAALLEAQPDALTSDLAASLAPAAFRAGEGETLFDLAERIPRNHPAMPYVRDLLWPAYRTTPSLRNSVEAEAILGRNIREDNAINDLLELAEHADRRGGPDDAVAVLRDNVGRVPEGDRKAVGKAVDEYLQKIK